MWTTSREGSRIVRRRRERYYTGSGAQVITDRSEVLRTLARRWRDGTDAQRRAYGLLRRALLAPETVRRTIAAARSAGAAIEIPRHAGFLALRPGELGGVGALV